MRIKADNRTPGLDLFDVLDDAASELEADGVLVSYEEFRRRMAWWDEDDPAKEPVTEKARSE